MTAMVQAARVDSRGRVTLPSRARQQLGLNPGDLVLVEVDPERNTVRVAKIVNPFDVLAVEALALDTKGLTVSDHDLVEHLRLDQNAEPLEIDDDLT